MKISLYFTFSSTVSHVHSVFDQIIRKVVSNRIQRSIRTRLQLQMHRSLSIFLISYLSFCHSQFYESIVRETRTLSSTSFDEIHIDGSFDIFLTQSKSNESVPTVEIETTLDNQKFIVVQINDNHILSIYINGSLKTEKNIYIYVRFPSPLRRLTIEGLSNIISDDSGIENSDLDKFIFTHRGSATIALRLNISDFEFYCRGTGNSRFSGEIRGQAMIQTEGINDIQALQLSVKKVKVTGMGFNLFRIQATDDIQIEMNGTYHIYYKLPYGIQASKLNGLGLGHISRMT